jgi:hypothetical protein
VTDVAGLLSSAATTPERMGEDQQSSRSWHRSLQRWLVILHRRPAELEGHAAPHWSRKREHPCVVPPARSWDGPRRDRHPGNRSRIRHPDHGLVNDESQGVTLLASSRLSAEVPASLPSIPREFRIVLPAVDALRNALERALPRWRRHLASSERPSKARRRAVL